MQMKLRVHFASGAQQDVTAQFSDFVMFERTWNKSVAKFSDDIRLTDLAWLAWKAMSRMKMTDQPFEPTWLESVQTVDVLTDEEEVTAPLDGTPPQVA